MNSRPYLFRLAALSLCLCLGFLSPADAQAYLLGPKDRLNIKVFEVRTSTGEIFNWEPLTGEFLVGPEGDIAMPLLGRILAAGRTADQLSQTISERMKSRIGLVSPPVVAVEIAEYRPFFIVGDVKNAGAFPFQPGLTVLQALGLAGGLARLEDAGLLRLRREALRLEGEAKLLQGQIRTLLARRARLNAELVPGDNEDIAWPPALERIKDNPPIQTLLEQERKIFNARRNALKTEISALENLKDTLEGEITSLGGQLEAQKKEQEVVKKDLANIASLVEKGLAASPRRTALERTIAELEGERLKLQTALLKAKQELGRTAILAVDARNTYEKEVTASLRQTEAELEDARQRYATAKNVFRETRPLAAGAFTTNAGSRSNDADYIIVRMKDGKPATIPAQEQTFVAPGDTIKVILPEPQLGDLGLAGAAPGN